MAELLTLITDNRLSISTFQKSECFEFVDAIYLIVSNKTQENQQSDNKNKEP